MAARSEYTPAHLRRELAGIMPGYRWTLHRGAPGYLRATGIRSSGFNRLSTLSVARRERDGVVEYEVKSAGYGTKARWLHTYTDGTLARALRGLQQHYEGIANTYRAHAAQLQAGRSAIAQAEGR